MTSFVITLYGQCCRRHIAGQQVVSDAVVVRSCWSNCKLYFESYDANLLLRLLIGERLLCFKNSKRSLTYNKAAYTRFTTGIL